MDKYTIRKLNLYLEKTTQGFLLLTVNEWSLQKQLMDVIESKIPVEKCDLKHCHLRSFLEEFQKSQEKKNLLFWNSEWIESEVDVYFEKINIARDYLQQMNCFLIFLLPEYVAEHIRVEYPNLHSYFVLKERCLPEYEYFFEYLFPGKDYLTTKEIQYNLKRSFKSEHDTWWSKVDYLLRVKVDKKEIITVIEQFTEHIENLYWEQGEYDLRYLYQSQLMFARVLVVQEYYSLAHEAYQVFFNMGQGFYKDLFHEAELGNADVWVLEKEYEQALDFYKKMLVHIGTEYEEAEESQYFLYRYKIYLRIASCYIEMEEFENAYSYLCALQEVKEAQHNISSEDLFMGNYNYVILLLRMKKYDECKCALESLQQMQKNSVQKAMFLCVKAYYDGVLRGKLFEAMKISKESLEIKRKIFIENDVRIAESHYVNSRLYLLLGNYKKAENCCRKCENILKNFPQRKDLKGKVDRLKAEIQEL